MTRYLTIAAVLSCAFARRDVPRMTKHYKGVLQCFFCSPQIVVGVLALRQGGE